MPESITVVNFLHDTSESGSLRGDLLNTPITRQETSGYELAQSMVDQVRRGTFGLRTGIQIHSFNPDDTEVQESFHLTNIFQGALNCTDVGINKEGHGYGVFMKPAAGTTLLPRISVQTFNTCVPYYIAAKDYPFGIPVLDSTGITAITTKHSTVTHERQYATYPYKRYKTFEVNEHGYMQPHDIVMALIVPNLVSTQKGEKITRKEIFHSLHRRLTRRAMFDNTAPLVTVKLIADKDELL